MLANRLRVAASGSNIPADGLVAAYNFNNNLVDFIGANNGASVGATSYHTGVEGQAIKGDGGYISLPALNIGGSQPRSISLWIKRGPATSIKTYFAFNGSGTVLTNCILHVGAVSVGDLYWGFGNSDFYTTGGLISNTNYHHVVVIYKGGVLSTTSVEIYVDNVKKSITKAGAQTGSANTANSNYRILSDSLSATRNADGFVDLLRVYDRAITSAEVAQLYDEV